MAATPPFFFFFFFFFSAVVRLVTLSSHSALFSLSLFSLVASRSLTQSLTQYLLAKMNHTASRRRSLALVNPHRDRTHLPQLAHEASRTYSLAHELSRSQRRITRSFRRSLPRAQSNLLDGYCGEVVFFVILCRCSFCAMLQFLKWRGRSGARLATAAIIRT